MTGCWRPDPERYLMWYRKSQTEGLTFEIQEYDEDGLAEIDVADTDSGQGYINAILDGKVIGGATFSYHSGVPVLESIGVDNPLNGVGSKMTMHLLQYWSNLGLNHSEFGWNASPYARALLQSLRNKGHEIQTNVPRQHWRSEEDWQSVVPKDIDSDRLDEDLKRTPYQWRGTMFGVSTAPAQKKLLDYD